MSTPIVSPDFTDHNMNLAYSALRITNIIPPQNEHHIQDNELMLRYQAYQATCEKFRHEIAAIQKYIPGWAPKFR